MDLAQVAPPEILAVLSRIQNMLVGLILAGAALGYIIAGVRYLTAAGDASGVGQAKATIRNTTIALLIALLFPVIIAIVHQIAGA